jgi:predicted phosphodiesterase
MVHHNPGPFEVVPGTKVSGLTDSAALIAVLDKHHKAKALIFGHTHNWDVKSRNSGLHLINLPPVAYPFAKEKPSGWVTARVDAKGMELELRCLNKAHPQHAEKKRIEWA